MSYYYMDYTIFKELIVMGITVQSYKFPLKLTALLVLRIVMRPTPGRTVRPESSVAGCPVSL